MIKEKNKQLKVLCAGSASYDVFLRDLDNVSPVCESFDNCSYNIHLGDKIYVGEVDFKTGGGASNASVTFSRGGCQTWFMGLLGCDHAGSVCVADLTKEGVDTSYVTYLRDYKTDYSTLLLDNGGERTILTCRSASSHLKPEHFNLVSFKQDIDWIYMSSMFGHFEVYKPFLEEAKRRGIKVAINPGGAELNHPEELRKIMPYFEIFSVNKQEAQKIVDGETIEELLVELRKLCPVVIITDGLNGSVIADRERAVRAGLYSPDDVSVDRTGAGDAFCSGFTLKYASGASLEEAVNFASANSSSVVMELGAKTGILNSEQAKNIRVMDIKPLSI